MRRAALAATAGGALLVLVIASASVGTPVRQGSAPYPRAVLVIDVPGHTLERLLAIGEVRSLAASGGAALLVDPAGAYSPPRSAPAGAPPKRERWVDLTGAEARADPGAAIRDRIASFPARRLMVVVVSLEPPAGAPRHVHPVVVSWGAPEALLAGEREPGTLTSDSTRRDGVVTGGDVIVTQRAYLDEPHPPGVEGSPLRIGDGAPPVELYERYVAQRRVYVPVGIAAGLYVTIAGLACIGLLALGERAPGWSRPLGAFLAIALVPLAVSLLLAGHLDRLTYATVVPFVLGLSLAGAGACTALGVRRGPLVALAWAGAATLAVLASEAVLGWTAAITPLLGGSQLDGGRYFGMPNVQIGLVVGATVYVAQRLRSPGAGAALAVVAGLVAGLPWTGSNLGAAATLFATAGIWFGLRTERGWARTIVGSLATTVVGVALVVVVHRVLAPGDTHVARFAEEASGPSDLWTRFVDRLGVGVRLIVDNPFAIVPVVGVLATLLVVLLPPAPVRRTFDAHPAWRDALLTILLGSAVAYVVNDSGAAALGLGFGTALAGLVFVSLLAGREKMVRT